MRRSSITVLLSASLLLLLSACAAHPPAAPPAPAASEPAPQARPESRPNGGTRPAFSPDGARIAFLSSTLHTPADLWLVNADGSQPRRLTTRGVSSFRWEPDGKSLLIQARRRGIVETFRLGLDGREEKVAGLPADASLPVPSPEGSLLAFIAPGEGDRVASLWVGAADGTLVEAVTEKIPIRHFFWGPDGRRIYVETGASYGLGLWEIDLASPGMRPVIDSFIGTPEFSQKAGRIAYPSPTGPGEFEVRTAALDGSDIRVHPSSRLAGRYLAWDSAGEAVLYLGQDVRKAEAKMEAPSDADKPEALHSAGAQEKFERFGPTLLWRLDLATGEERRLTPEGLHLIDFSVAPGGKLLLTGVVPESFSSEIFVFDPASGNLERLTASRPSSWMPVPSVDSSRVALFTNEFGSDALLVTDAEGTVQAVYPAPPQGGELRLFWLPESGGMVLFSGWDLQAFTDGGPIEFPNRMDHGGLLYADVSVQGDKILLNSIPKFGETPGLYLLEAKGDKLVQTDLRFSPEQQEVLPEAYLQPKWSFDGKHIAFADRVDIWTMQAEGVGRKWITDYFTSNKQEGAVSKVASHPAWSIGGDKICYTLTVYEGKRILRQIWVVAADGSNPRMLHSEEIDSAYQLYLNEYTTLPFFDPSDKRVIFVGVENGLPNLFAAEVESGRLQRLTENGAIFPALLFEDDAILYTSLAGNGETLWIMNSDGSGKRPFALKAKEGEPPVADVEGEAAPGQEKGESQPTVEKR